MITKILRRTALIILAALGMAATGCDNHKSYAELLAEENFATNDFLSNQRVVGYENRDSSFNFEYGKDAPYYQIDPDKMVFMQVVKPGTPGNYAKYNQLIYFRFTRYNLLQYKNATLPSGEGNDQDVSGNSTNFRFDNDSSTSYAQWGEGLQMPLRYLPIDCEVNIVIKSQMGPAQEIGNVQPFLYNVRYFKSQI